MKGVERDKKGALAVLIEKLEECSDFRDPARIDYTLAEILFLTFCGCVCDCESYKEIVDFGEIKLCWLRKFLPYEKGIPSHDTIGRVLSMLNTKELEKGLISFCKYSFKLSTGEVFNIDGKRLNRSASAKEQQTKKEKGGKQAVNMVNLYCSEFNACLASIRVSSKEGEKDALDDILGLLDTAGCMLTFDAGYCYKDVAEKVVGSEADYLIGLKENQPKLLEAAQDLLSRCPAVEVYNGKEESNSGRVEQRTCKVLNFSNLENEYKEDYGDLFKKWVGLNCLIMVVCLRTVKATGKTSREPRFYISSREMMPKKANTIVRGHWGVENCLHWVLDVIFGEDKSTKRSGNSAANFSILRKLAFNMLKNFDDPKVSMKRKVKKAAMSGGYLEKILGIS